MTRDPPLNGVGVTLAASAPLASSKMSLAMLRPRCTAQPATSASNHQPSANESLTAATAPPSAIGTIVAVRKGSRVARKNVHHFERCGRWSPTSSMYSCAIGTLRSAYSKKGTSASSQPVARVAVTESRVPAADAGPQTLM